VRTTAPRRLRRAGGAPGARHHRPRHCPGSRDGGGDRRHLAGGAARDLGGWSRGSRQAPDRVCPPSLPSAAET